MSKFKIGDRVDFIDKNSTNAIYFRGNIKNLIVDKPYKSSESRYSYQLSTEDNKYVFGASEDELELHIIDEMKGSNNNGGSTDYYKFGPKWKECGDIIEAREMNYNQGNIFKSAFCFNIGRHTGTDYERELNKIVYFANRELIRIKESK